jgi:5-methylcytosine-specific restriction endonuclease McrA
VSDFGLGDKALDSKKLSAALRWHLGVQPAALTEGIDLEKYRADIQCPPWERPRTQTVATWSFPNGATSYKGYLKSALWKKIRRRILRRDEFTCQACLCQSQCVHHIDYNEQTLAGKSRASLISLCNSCHHKIEHQFGKKIPCSQEERKRQLLDDLMVRQRGLSLAEWQRCHGDPKPATKKERRAAKGRRKKMEKRQRSQHAALGAQAHKNLEVWRELREWERVNVLKESGLQ